MEGLADVRSLQHVGAFRAKVWAMDRNEFSNALSGAGSTVSPQVMRAAHRAYPYLRPEWRPGTGSPDAIKDAIGYTQMYSWILISTGRAWGEDLEARGSRVPIEDLLRIDVMQGVQAGELNWKTLASLHRLSLLYLYSPSLHLDFDRALAQAGVFAQVLRQEILSGRNRRYLLDSTSFFCFF